MRASFVIPAYNAESTVRAAVESALGQSYPAAEVIVVDDHSTDRTVRVLEGIADPRLKVFKSSRNRGPAAARNAGIEASDADLIACLDADDAAAPSRLALQVPVFARNQRAILVCGSAISQNGVGERLSRDGSPSNPGALAWALRFRNPIFTSTATFRRVIALEAGGFPEASCPSEDHALWLALAVRGEIVSLLDVLVTRTIRGGSLTALNAEKMEQKSIHACIEAIAKLTGHEPSESAFRVLRRGAAPGQTPESVLEEATGVWCAVFDAVQRELVSASYRRAAARGSLNELRSLLRACPIRRFDLLRETMGPRRWTFAGAVLSIQFLKLSRTMVKGR
jgi:glycosyltransferase involved in cell wall biosynthesis